MAGISFRDLLLTIRLRDDASRRLNEIRSAFSDTAAAGAKLKSVGTAFVSMGVGLAALGGAGVVAMKDLVGASFEYENATRKALTQTNGLGQSLEGLQKIGVEVARDIPAKFEEMQGALYDIFSTFDFTAIFKNGGAAAVEQQAKGILTELAKVAVAGGVTMETATNTALASLNAWGLGAEDLTRVNDILFQTVARGRGDYTEFANAIGKVIPVAIGAGQSLEQVAAALAFTTSRGANAAQAATSVSSAMTTLVQPKVVSQLEKMGVYVKNNDGSYRDFSNILADIRTKFKGLSESQVAEKLIEITKGAGNNKQAMQFLKIALAESTDEYDSFVGSMTNSQGALENAYQIMKDSPGAQLQALANSMNTLKSELGDLLWKQLSPGLTVLQNAINWFQNLDEGTKNNIVTFLLWGTVAALIVGGLLILVGTVLMLYGAVAALAIPLGLFTGIALGVVAAIVLIIAIGVLLYQNWDLVKQKAGELWNWIQTAFNNIKQAIVNAFTSPAVTDGIAKLTSGWSFFVGIMSATGGAIMESLGKLREAWDKLANSPGIQILGQRLSEIGAGVWFAIQAIAAFVGMIIGGVLAVVLGVVIGVVNGIIQAFMALVAAVMVIINGLINIVSGFVTLLAGIFSGDLSMMADGVMQIFAGLVSVVAGLIGGFVGIIGGFIHGLVMGVIGWFTFLWDTLVGHSIIPDMVTGIITWIGSLPGAVIAFIVGMVTSVVAQFLSLATTVISTVTSFISNLLSMFGRSPMQIIAAIASLPGLLLAQAIAWGASLLSGSNVSVSNVLSFFASVPSRILGALGNVGSLLWSAGSSVMRGLYNGLVSSWGLVTDFVGGIASWIARNKGPKEKDLKLLIPAGQWILQGLSQGLEAGMPYLENSINNITDRIRSTTFAPALPASIGIGSEMAYAGIGGSGVNMPIVVNTQEIDPVKHAADLGWEVARKLGL